MSKFVEAFKTYYVPVLTDKFATFSGRARRKEYWFFHGFNFLFMIGFAVLASIFWPSALQGVLGVLYLLFVLGILIPGLAVLVRRLHDTNHSGWWYFISLVPLIGGIWLLVLLIRDSQPETNPYGPNPKIPS